ncbi:MAG: 30S ribosomal protein S17 [Bacilli bacterium]|nr:30S ribosomal protein S17 [Bacilli bacterium]MDD4387976.1 30S ribosomal protein S17 [Bacilli bacterium]
MERNKRKVYTGKVISDKENKTIKVMITSYRRHRLYGKRVVQTVKFTAHDENDEAKIGDIVRIMETRPLSKNKHFRLLKIVQRAESV